MDRPLLLDAHAFASFADRQFDLHVFPNINESFATAAEHQRLYSRSLGAKMGRVMRGIKVYKEPHYHLDPGFFALTAPVYLQGYSQSEKYFADYADGSREKFA